MAGTPVSSSRDSFSDEYSEEWSLIEGKNQEPIFTRVPHASMDARRSINPPFNQLIRGNTDGAFSHSFKAQQFAFDSAGMDASVKEFYRSFQKISISGPMDPATIDDINQAAEPIIRAIRIRRKYIKNSSQCFNVTAERYLNRRKGVKEMAHDIDNNGFNYTDQPYHPPFLSPSEAFNIPLKQDFENCFLSMKNGVFRVYDNEQLASELPCTADILPSAEVFHSDFLFLQSVVEDSAINSYAFSRLSYLKSKFDLHIHLNGLKENTTLKSVPHRDFYNVRKVDNHVHAASCMNQKHLLRFMKKKMRTVPDMIVCKSRSTDAEMTLKQLFDSMNIKPSDLNVDLLAVHADRNTFKRFDKFNAKYNPIGESRLREIFIKCDNYIEGKFFAELLKEIISDVEDSKYQQMEPRLSIYGRSYDEWDKLAKWIISNDLHSQNVQWMIQIPRIYDIFRNHGVISSFECLLDNIFRPLFEATLYPSKHPDLFRFLMHVRAVDTVDDESKPERHKLDVISLTPNKWTHEENPPYIYYLYFIYANLTILNSLRRERGLNTVALRPHSGEAGPWSHLIGSFMLAESIAHGVTLAKSPILQYLFYLCQIGIAMSPLSNNSLFLEYSKNPFPTFFKEGLFVSLSTDDPLQFHFTKEPLIEEYSIAAQVWKLSSVDMCEIARNSVIMSSFPAEIKNYWLGSNHALEGVDSNDIRRTNVPDIRIMYRHETLCNEFDVIFDI